MLSTQYALKGLSMSTFLQVWLPSLPSPRIGKEAGKEARLQAHSASSLTMKEKDNQVKETGVAQRMFSL